MNKLVFCLSILFFISCGIKNNIKNSSAEDEFVIAYKKAVLYGCLNEATNGNFNEFSQKNNDLGLAAEVAVIQHAESESATKLGAKLSKKIEKSQYEDYNNKKPIFSNCVNFAFSTEVDSLVRLIYRNKIKN